MCGIAGLIDFSLQSAQEDLLRMTNSLHHRGPDGVGFELINTSNAIVGLGHRRLSIIDLSNAGHQPMHYKDYSITFNGEIYNFKDIKIDLEKLGHSFLSHSDTEVILHAFEQWGENCLNRFRGMFALVIFDRKNEKVFCARDRAGIKPFFYYYRNNIFLFASELKAFHQHPQFMKEINKDAVAAFMQYGNVPEPHCIFNHCFKLKPGSFLTLDLADGKMEATTYWNVYDAYNRPKLSIDFSEAKKETEKVLSEAFNFRMVADVPVGVFLSGGYDSACVTALLQKDAQKPLKTFTIGVPDIGLNEAPFAKDVAKHLGTDHTEIYCTEKESLDLIVDLPFYYDEPFGDSSSIPTMLVSKMAKKEVTVALSADGGDEIFAGYNRYDFLIRYRAKMDKIPAFGRRSIAALMNKVPSNSIPVLRNKYNFHNRYEKLKGIMKDPSPQRIMLSLSQQFTDEQLKNLLQYVPGKMGNAYLSSELKKEFYSPLAYMMAIDYQTYLLDDILQKVDRATMSASLEGREPFLDHHVIEWAAQLPDDFKYHNGEKKFILKEIVHQYLPKEMMQRPKMGFAIPMKDWLLNQLSEYLETYLNEDIIVKQGLFNWEFVSKLKMDFKQGKKEYDQKIWYLLVFQMWYAKWMQ